MTALMRGACISQSVRDERAGELDHAEAQVERPPAAQLNAEEGPTVDD
jgi:hypothetical protein